MLISQLARIPEFSEIEQSELRALAAQARILCLPRDRWLVQRGRDLGAYFYLLRGAVRTEEPEVQIRYSGFGKLRHFYPGCKGVRTMSACQILVVKAAQREFLMHKADGYSGVAESKGSWLADFLHSQMMQELETEQWQLLLKAFRRLHFQRGADVVVQNQPADACFVVESGHGVIHGQGRTLRYLSPGDFFGEDALILHSLRNATVTAQEAMIVHAVEGAVFERWLLRALVQPVRACAAGIQLNLTAGPLALALAQQMNDVRRVLECLDARVNYYVTGGTERQRDLVAFLLLQRGIRANPVVC